MEPAWMKNIPSPLIGNFFYVFYVIYAILFVLSLLFTIGVFTYSKKMGGAGIALGIQSILMTGFGGTLVLFYYLICDRALLGKAVVDAKENFALNK